MATTYINGDEGEYTGETQTIHGGLFYSVRMTEGRRAGQILVTQRVPNGTHPNDGQFATQWQAQQADFRRLNRH